MIDEVRAGVGAGAGAALDAAVESLAGSVVASLGASLAESEATSLDEAVGGLGSVRPGGVGPMLSLSVAGPSSALPSVTLLLSSVQWP